MSSPPLAPMRHLIKGLRKGHFFMHPHPSGARAREMGELGVADRYVDAFCGRVPRSVLARHYTDFSPERLKRVYDKVGLKVLV